MLSRSAARAPGTASEADANHSRAAAVAGWVAVRPARLGPIARDGEPSAGVRLREAAPDT